VLEKRIHVDQILQLASECLLEDFDSLGVVGMLERLVSQSAVYKLSVESGEGENLVEVRRVVQVEIKCGPELAEWPARDVDIELLCESCQMSKAVKVVPAQ
jgi:hypothetical protein